MGSEMVIIFRCRCEIAPSSSTPYYNMWNASVEVFHVFLLMGLMGWALVVF